MRSKRLSIALPLLTALMASGQNAEIQLGDDFVLKGDIVSLENGKFEIRHEGADKPMIVSPDKITLIEMLRDYSDAVNLQDSIQLADGSDNAIPCKIIGIDHDKVTFQCPFTQMASIDRSKVIGISFNRRNLKPLWSLPVLFDSSWRIQEEGEKTEDVRESLASMKPVERDGSVFYSFGKFGANLFKQIGLDYSSFEFSSTVQFEKQKGKIDPPPQLTFIFQTHYTNHTVNGKYRKYRILASFKKDTWSLILDEELSPQKKLVQIQVKNPLSPMKVMVKAYKNANDGNSTTYELHVNGETAKSSLTTPDNLSETGSFGIKATKNAGVTLENPMLSNVLEQEKAQFTSSGKYDQLETNESETLPGTLSSYSRKNHTFAFKLDNSEETIGIPGRYITAVIFVKPKQAGTAPGKKEPFAPCQVTLNDGSSWKGSSPSISRGKLNLHNELLGKMSIPLSLISFIEFRNQQSPTKSTP